MEWRELIRMITVGVRFLVCKKDDLLSYLATERGYSLTKPLGGWSALAS